MLQMEIVGEIEEQIIKIVTVLRTLRVQLVFEEFALQEQIVVCLQKAGFSFQKEYKLASRNRIDFLIEGGIGIEVKKGKPNRTQVGKQLERYTSFDEIQAVILVVERNVYLPAYFNRKPCVLFGLNRLWGVALK